MTSLNPSHNPFASSAARHGQAVHDPTNQPEDEFSDIDSDLGGDNRTRRTTKREARQRVRKAMPPMPDLRFEQSYLLSIRPFLTPRPTRQDVQERGKVGADKQTKSLVASTEDDSVFHWGREVDVNWKMVLYVTLRDQLFSPLVQGALWGWGTVLLASTSMALRSALYPASHTPRGRMTGGPGGKVSEAGTAAGETGWWRKWVKSFGGAVESATV